MLLGRGYIINEHKYEFKLNVVGWLFVCVCVCVCVCISCGMHEALVPGIVVWVVCTYSAEPART